MPRTFSLARLMLVITLIGLACGCAVNFPYEYLIDVFVFFPTLVPALVLFYFSKSRTLSLCFTLLGYLYGFAAPPLIEALARSFEFAEPVKIADASHFIMPGFLAFVAGLSYLLVERYLLRLKNKQPQIELHAL
jgi:hypothetical protein